MNTEKMLGQIGVFLVRSLTWGPIFYLGYRIEINPHPMTQNEIVTLLLVMMAAPLANRLVIKVREVKKLLSATNH